MQRRTAPPKTLASFKPNQRSAATSNVSTENARCQRCLQSGHWTPDCPNKQNIYKSRPTRSALLKDPSLRLPEQIIQLGELEKQRESAARELLKQSSLDRDDEPTGLTEGNKRVKMDEFTAIDSDSSYESEEYEEGQLSGDQSVPLNK